MKKTIKISVKKIICILLAVMLIYHGGMKIWASTVDTTSVNISDSNLYNALKTRLSKYTIERDDSTKTLEIRTDAIAEINELDLSNCQITNLSGIEKFNSLINLNLSKNTISEISSLSELVNLKNLNLSNNTISNIRTISSLTNLTNLNLSSNKISDISSLSNLSKLQELDLSNNTISTATVINNLNALTVLNISQNSSLANLSDVLNSNLTSLNVSNTAITNIEGITSCNKLTELKISNNNITNLSPLFKTESVDGKNVAILRNLEKLDISATTRNGLTFSSIKTITELQELYAQRNSISNISGIAELKKLQYVNLDDNNISNIDSFRTTKTQNGQTVTKDLITATQISMANNQIDDISVLSYLSNIEYLNMSGNHIQIVTPIENFKFSKGLNLRNQTIDMPIYKKKNDENHYVVLLNIMQNAKNSGSVVYNENANFTTEGVTLNSQDIYNVAPYYNVIISPDKTDKDTLSVTLHGGPADGTKINFKISTSTSAVETLMFEDPNLDSAIYSYLSSRLTTNSYIARAPYIINITQKEIANIKELDISSMQIQKLKGLSNFINLQNLNLSNNKVSDDSEIKYLTNLTTLNFANNQLNNKYSSIENLYTLTNLDLTGNNIQDLNSINNFITNLQSNKKTAKLVNLTLSNNNISDVDVLSKLTTLQKLNISNNKIQDITPIKTDVSIDTLNISGNSIENIDILNQLQSVRTLNMANNLIQDITPITNLSLTSLDISGNRITNIEPIKTQTGLIDLYINNNKIDDVSAIEQLLLRGTFEAKQQKITKILDQDATGTITMDLPAIFKSAKNTGSKVYTSNDFSTENCTITSDGKLQINTNEIGDNKVAKISIIGGQADSTTFSVAEALKGTITYNPKNKTKDNVTATISFNREGATILNNDGKNSYVFTSNGEFTFIYKDENGFDGEAKATVDWIDNEGPQVNVKYSTEEITNQDVIVTITTNEKIANNIEGWNFTDDNHLEITKTFNENAEETVKLQDELGNVTETKVIINNIDKKAPIILNVENGKTYENSVTPNIQDDNLESITLIKDGTVANGYTNGKAITEKGSYKLTAIDKAGNETSVEFIINKTVVNDNISSSKYNVGSDNYITRISPNTNLSVFESNISTEIEYKITDKSGKDIAETNLICTGYKLVTSTGKTYTLIVIGDINGDGKITVSDLSLLQKQYLQLIKLNGEYEKGADINNDKKVNLSDLSLLTKVMLGIQNV